MVRNVAPDLIVHFGDLYWRSIGGVGYGTVHVQENDTGPDDCNHAQHGGFILAAPGLSVEGEIEGLHLLDLAPTLLELGGYDLPDSMQGRSLLSGQGLAAAAGIGLSTAGEAIIRERLRGLGYIS
jgi:predicted AlkP superfamily phosphohydrolase/phosphomutase